MADILKNAEDILSVLNELSEADNERECMEEEDNVEYDELSEDHDSDADPEYVPDEDDLLQVDNNAVENIRQIEVADLARPPSKRRNTNRTVEPGPSQQGTQQIIVNNSDKLVYKIDGEDGIVVAENGFFWGTECNTNAAKTPAKNVVHIRPGPCPTARQAYSPLECFQLFFSDDLVAKILQHTNEEIKKTKTKL